MVHVRVLFKTFKCVLSLLIFVVKKKRLFLRLFLDAVGDVREALLQVANVSKEQNFLKLERLRAEINGGTWV